MPSPGTNRSPEEGFNGATPFQTWKSSGPGCGRYDRRKASMGPRLFRRGNAGPGTRRVRSRRRFNGATPFQTWKYCPPGVNGAVPVASMGPRLFRRGNSGHFSGSPDAEKMAVFERSAFVSVPLTFLHRFCLDIRYQAPFRAVPGFLVTTIPLAAGQKTIAE